MFGRARSFVHAAFYHHAPVKRYGVAGTGQVVADQTPATNDARPFSGTSEPKARFIRILTTGNRPILGGRPK